MWCKLQIVTNIGCVFRRKKNFSFLWCGVCRVSDNCRLNFTSTAQLLCELCDDREVAFWCNECRKWMCAQCKRSHIKIPSTKDHDVTPLALKVEQIKRSVRQQAAPAQQKAATMTSQVAQLQQALEKLDVKQAEFLQQSDDLRQKYVQQINNHFDD